MKTGIIQRSIKAITYDIDYAGHVSNTSFVRWLEDMRFQFLEEYYPMETLLRRGVFPVVAKTCISYRTPMKLFDECIGRMWISGVERFRYCIRATFGVNEREYASAEHVIAFINAESAKLQRIPEDLRQLLRSYTLDSKSDIGTYSI